jgi:hypothetical protein
MKKREKEMIRQIIDRLENYEAHQKLFDEVWKDIEKHLEREQTTSTVVVHKKNDIQL